jgi:hypothetical protein
MRFKSTRTLLAVAATVFAALCATALADFTVYDNDFSSRSEFKQIIKSGSAKKCDRRFREKSKSMLASVKRGKTTCTFRPPVEGDDELPNQTVRVDGKILKKTPKSVRGGAFLELTLRSGGSGVGYTLRVFPQKQRFELLRGPAGNGFPQQGDSDAIKKINKRNSLSLTARGAKVEAFINGKQVAEVDDENPGQVSGTKIRFSVGNAKQKSKDVAATFKRVSVAVP